VSSRWVALPIAVAVLLAALLGAAYTYPLRAAFPPPQPVVCVHFDLSKPLDLAKKLIDYAAELGAKYVRFDIWWKDIEPTMGQFNYTALDIYKEIIIYMRSKGLQPIAILGTGYPKWAEDLILRYYSCKFFCRLICGLFNFEPNPLSYPDVDATMVSTVFNLTADPSLEASDPSPQWIIDAIERSEESYLEYGGPEIELEIIENIMETCPDYYEASAKGFLTAEELAEISKKCPGLPIRVSTAELELNDGVIYVKPLPQIYTYYEVLKGADASTYSVGVSPEFWWWCPFCIRRCYNIFIGAFLNEAYQYAKVVASSLWYLVDYYQLGNELNHFINPVPYEVDSAFIAALGRGVNDGDPGLRYKIVNVIVDLIVEWPYWDNTLRSWLDSAGSFIDIVAIDHYPGTWTSTGWDYWTPLDKLISITQSYNKVPAIMETGYPSGDVLGIHSEYNQALYIDVAFGEIMKRAQNTYIAFLSWYMLWDEMPWWEALEKEFPYYGWGVLRLDFSKKPAWNTLSYWFKYKLRS